MVHPDFAKIIRLEDGSQALFYFEPDGEEVIFHQIFLIDRFQIDLSLRAKDFDDVRIHLHLCGLTIEDATKIRDRALEIMGQEGL